MTQFIKTWQGEAVNWECDELGHLNMRHYMTKASQARQMFFILMGLENAFKDQAMSSVRVRDFHIRYIKEARPGARLRIETGFVGCDTESAELVHMMYHHNGDVAATIHETVDHIYMRTGRKFNWPKRFLDRTETLRVSIPAIAKPRGFDPKEIGTGPTREALKQMGAVQIGLGVFQSRETDVLGLVTPQSILGRASESVGNFKAAWPEMYDPSRPHIHGALLEARTFMHLYPRPGDPYEIYSGIRSANKNVRQLIHNCVNPITGQNWCSMIAVSCLIDLEKRVLVKATPDMIEQLNSNAIAALHA